MCVNTIYSILTQVLSKKSQAYYSGGIQTQNLCNSRAVSYRIESYVLAAGTANVLNWNVKFELYTFCNWIQVFVSTLCVVIEYTMKIVNVG